MVVLALPFPPSVNRYWRHFRGITIVSEEGLAFRAEVCARAMEARIRPIDGDLRVGVRYHPKKPKVDAGRPVRRMDLDNILKGPLDALEGHAFNNDRQIVELQVTLEEPVPEGKVVVEIERVVKP